MSQTLEQVKQFYRGSWDELSIFDLGMLCSSISMSIASGQAIELKHWDGFMNRKKQLQISDRVDVAECLKALSDVLIERLKNLSKAELDEFDRVQKVFAAAQISP